MKRFALLFCLASIGLMIYGIKTHKPGKSLPDISPSPIVQAPAVSAAPPAVDKPEQPEQPSGLTPAMKADAQRVLDMLVQKRIVTSYDRNGNVRVDPLVWIPGKRADKAAVIETIFNAYAVLKIEPSFDVLSDRSDEKLASRGFWSGVTIYK
jgi:hypothetical protein